MTDTPETEEEERLAELRRARRVIEMQWGNGVKALSKDVDWDGRAA